jgi:hypothetical protein
MSILRRVWMVLLLAGCGFYQRHQQIKTIVTLRAIATYVGDALERQNGHITESDVRRAINSVHAGRDAWGTQIAFRLRMIHDRSSYVLVSAGSDRSFDVPDLNVYFQMKTHDTKTDSRRDLVVRDGELITLAGK